MGAKQSQPDAAAGAAEQSGGFGRGPALGASKTPVNKVQFAAMPLGGVPGATAYHSSVIVNDMEYSFSDGGILCTSGLESHRQMAQQQQQKGQPATQPEVIDMGFSHYTGSMLQQTLERHFRAGTYDFLRKNCNSFADTAIFYLLQKRIDKKYRALDKIGANNPSMIAAVSGGQYSPNPKADGFDVDKLCQELDPSKKWDMPGQAVGGGQAAASAEEMRAARLARLSGGGGGGGGGGAPSGGYAAATPPAAAGTAGGAGSGQAQQSGSGGAAAS